MSESDDLSPFMLALGGWMGGTGITLILTAIQETQLNDPVLTGTTFGVAGSIIIMSELYIGRLE